LWRWAGNVDYGGAAGFVVGWSCRRDWRGGVICVGEVEEEAAKRGRRETS